MTIGNVGSAPALDVDTQELLQPDNSAWEKSDALIRKAAIDGLKQTISQDDEQRQKTNQENQAREAGNPT
jgi:hypothetical protein